MTADYEISLATLDDIPGILTIQEPNLIERGGGLSMRRTADWFRNAVIEKSIVVDRHDDKVVGYVLGTSLAAKAHVTIIQTRLDLSRLGRAQRQFADAWMAAIKSQDVAKVKALFHPATLD